MGETMGLFRATAVGSLAHVSELHLSIGGAESNVAIALTRLGTPTTWLGRVGDDSLGERVVRELRGEGINVLAIVDPNAPTGIMVKESRTFNSTRVIYYRTGSAGSRLSAADVAAAPIAAAALVHVSGITPALSDQASDAVNVAVDTALAAEVRVSFDVNHRSNLWRGRDASDTYRRIATKSTVVFSGVDEARLLVGEAAGPRQLAHAIAALGPTQVIIKLGERGCFALVDGVEYEREAVPVRVLDTVGAGDAFVAGYLSELLRERPVTERLTTAVTTGAFACLNPGDWEGYPRRNELSLITATEPVSR